MVLVLSPACSARRKHKAVSPDDFVGKEAKKMLQRLLGQDKQKDWEQTY